MNQKKPKILVVDDEKNIRESIILGLKDDYSIIEAGSGTSAINILLKEQVDLVFLDLKLPDIDGIRLMKEIHRFDDMLNIIMITADNSVQTAVKAMKQGAYDYITKPFDIDELSSLAAKAIEKTNLQKENQYLKASSKTENGNIIGKSKLIKELLSMIDNVAKTNSTVLITGETGVGKELVARALHKYSDRANKLFVAVNCSAIPENLLESELFGHEKGAFTSAMERHIGKFEMASGGTLFLDEVGTLPLAMQAKLLRAIQEKQIERVGGEKPINIDSRIISATNIDLKKMAGEGKFREDLYYRLNVIPIHVPSLRERENDIELLCEYFIAKHNKGLRKNIKGLDKHAAKRLKEYSWPGNVRELENLIERLIVLGKNEYIAESDLPFEITGSKQSISHAQLDTLSLKEATGAFEKEFILKALEKSGFSKAKAAKMLGIHRNTLLKLENRLK